MGRSSNRKANRPRSRPRAEPGGGPPAAHAEARRAAERGDVARAIGLYVELVKAGSQLPDVYNDLGALLAGSADGQRLPSAIVQFEIALALDPGHENARSNLARALESMSVAAFEGRRWADAAAGYARLAALAPASAIFHNNAGAAYRELKRPDLALAHLARAATLEPGRATVHYNLGSVLFDLGDAACEPALLRAIGLVPDYVEAHVNLGLVYFKMGRFDAAEDHLLRALGLSPGHGDAHGHLATVLRELGRLPESLVHYRRARALRPDSVEIASNDLLARQADPLASAADLLAASREFAARFADPLAPARPAAAVAQETAAIAVAANGDHRSAAPGSISRRLKVGYVSADFRSHSVAKFVEPILAHHDRAAFEIFAYSDAVPDPVTRRLEGLVDRWFDARRLDDAALAERIAADRIDLLVDLAGHTGNHRLLCFARRPAPVQVTYCGYPGTTGLSTMDWRLTDAHADPEGEGDLHGTEKPWRLPNGFLCFRPDEAAPALTDVTPARTRGSFTFGSFNNLAKVGEGVMRVWAAALHAVPGSRLVMKSRALGDDRPRARLRRAFEALGIAPDRLELLGYASSTAEHLALYATIDLALDPFPYNGTTTTCEALWMGVPVVTLLGDRHAGRVGASVLRGVGLPQLVAIGASEYVEICAEAARDLERLSALRSDLRRRLRASPLLDPATIVRDLESAYRRFVGGGQ